MNPGADFNILNYKGLLCLHSFQVMPASDWNSSRGHRGLFQQGKSGWRNLNNADREETLFSMWVEDWHKYLCFYELQEFNVYFIDTEQSFCFIYLLWIAASQCHGTSFSERLKSVSKIKSWRFFLVFFFPQTKTFQCVSAHPLSLMTCKRLVYLERLMDYITYGFFESNKNKANQKVHPTHTKKKINSSLWWKSVLSWGLSSVLTLLAQCLHCSGRRWPDVDLLPFSVQRSKQTSSGA